MHVVTKRQAFAAPQNPHLLCTSNSYAGGTSWSCPEAACRWSWHASTSLLFQGFLWAVRTKLVTLFRAA